MRLFRSFPDLRGPVAGAALACAALLGAAVSATAQETEAALAASLLGGSYIAAPGEPPAAALARLDAGLAQLETVAAPEPRLVFALLTRKAELLEETGDGAGAATLWQQLGQLAARQRAALGEDPAQLYARAAALFDAVGQPEDAARSLALQIAELRDGGQGGPLLADALTRLAALEARLGDPDAAARTRAMAEAARAGTPVADAPTRGDAEGYVPVDVYYATDRKRTDSPYPGEVYGADRADGLDYGKLRVTIPNDHRPGQIELPSIWRLEYGASPAKHVTLASVTPMPRDGFFGALAEDVETRAGRELFVFVHGFNTDFREAALRAGQIAFDMNFSGVPVLYSWPSQGSSTGYIRDTAVVRLSGRRLTRFLDDLVAQSGARVIHLVAHSMGNRALTDALELMALRRAPVETPPFGQVIFAAPDVDAGLFGEMVPTIRPLAQRLTLYGSEQDWALWVSRQLHGDAPRAGEAHAVEIAGLDAIDMSELGRDMLAHNYYSDDSSALVDLATLFLENLDPVRRCGLERSTAASVWRYRRTACDVRALVAVLTSLKGATARDPEALGALVRETLPDPALAARITPIVQRMFAR